MIHVRIVKKIDYFLQKPLRFGIPFYNRIYWYLRAKSIDVRWGKLKGDYGFIKNIILPLKIKTLLDIGCGTGRLFPLYKSLNIKHIVGQDIAKNALDIAEKRYGSDNITLTDKKIENLEYPNHYFDVIISNRVLQHVIPKDIEGVIRKITDLSHNIYLNEMTDSDNGDVSNFLFKHDYKKLFNNHNFILRSTGKTGDNNQETWYLFSKNPKN